MSKSIGPWLINNAGIISVVGALIIFFSWAVANTLGQRQQTNKRHPRPHRLANELRRGEPKHGKH